MADCSLSAASVAADGCIAAARVTGDGGLWVTGVVDPAVIAAAADQIDARLASAITSVNAVLGTPDGDDGAGPAVAPSPAALEALEDFKARWLGPVHARTNRWDLRLRMTGEVRKVVVAVTGCLAPMLQELLTDGAVICELSCVISDPGAPRQPLHTDTDQGGPGLITVFIPVQTVEPDMGPTLLLPGTHTAEAHTGFEADNAGSGDALLADPTRRQWSFEAQAGDVMAMDSRLLHCGGQNQSEKRRRLLYFTVNAPHCKPAGGTYSLLSEYAGRFKIGRQDTWVDVAGYADEVLVAPEPVVLTPAGSGWGWSYVLDGVDRGSS